MLTEARESVQRSLQPGSHICGIGAWKVSKVVRWNLTMSRTSTLELRLRMLVSMQYWYIYLARSPFQWLRGAEPVKVCIPLLQPF